MPSRFFFAIALLCGMSSALADPPIKKTFTLEDYDPPRDGTTDATPALTRLFVDVAAAGGGSVVIPPGEYYVPGKTPIPLPSRTTVVAHGAVFRLPEKLGDQARLVVFHGQNVRGLSWSGGEFRGRCFDPASDANTWEPNANTRIFLVTTNVGGTTDDVTFRDLRSDGIAGAVVTVLGDFRPHDESHVGTFATNVTVADCTLLASGKFMWDYGYLWQIVVWPEDHVPREHAFAEKYFPHDAIRGDLTMADGDDRVVFDNARRPIPVSKSAASNHALCFFGDALPANVVRGKQYFIVESAPTHLKISDRPGGLPLVFQGAAGTKAKLIYDLFRTYRALYAPLNGGPGKGAVDLVGCRSVRVTGCRLSARGDTMHIQRSHDVLFAQNHVVGSRMGAFFLAEYCRNATVTGNLIDGTNGSRVMSVEKSCRDVTIVGNTFRNGGRGSWINQPTNFVLQGNVFVNNTTKCERDPRRGRRSFETGEYETYPELYFTLHQPDGRYDGVIVKDNVFETGPECGPCMTFAKNGSRIVVVDNILKGAGRTIVVDPSCTDVIVKGNVGVDEAK